MKSSLAVILSVIAFFQYRAHALDKADKVAEAPAAAEPENPKEPRPDVFPRWTIIGDWRVTHPDWTGVLTLHPDGSITNTLGAKGRWTLAGDGGTILLVMRWELFGTESASMVAPDHFRGQIRRGRFIDMRRVDEHPAPIPVPEAK